MRIRNGDLWAGGITGLWRWRPGPPTPYALEDPAGEVSALSEGDDGGILVARRSGITPPEGGESQAVSASGRAAFAPNRLLRDRHGGLWIGAMVDMGLLHIHDGRTIGLRRTTACQAVQSHLCSRIVKATSGRRPWMAASTASACSPSRRCLCGKVCPVRAFYSILAARDGSLWLGMSDALNRWNKRTNHDLSQAKPAWRARSGIFCSANSPRHGTRLEGGGARDYRQWAPREHDRCPP